MNKMEYEKLDVKLTQPEPLFWLILALLRTQPPQIPTVAKFIGAPLID